MLLIWKILITVDKAISLEYAILDVGIFLQTFCLLAHDRGLGTCSMAASVYYPEILRKHFPVPNTKRILMGVALGWPDKDDPVNRFERKRAPLDEIVQWVS
jgi:nitroreductase